LNKAISTDGPETCIAKAIYVVIFRSPAPKCVTPAEQMQSSETTSSKRESGLVDGPRADSINDNLLRPFVIDKSV